MDFEWRTTDLSLENMNGNCKMGTKSQVRLQGGGGYGCFKTRFVFKVGFFVVPHASDFSLSDHGIQFCKMSQRHKMTIL